MKITVITGLQYKNGDIVLPKKGTTLEVSDDGKVWQKAYFIQVDNKINPFICVDTYTGIEFPVTKGINYGILRITEYEIEDVILTKISFKKNSSFKTVDGLYETHVEGLCGYSYWSRTKLGEQMDVPFIWNHKGYDYVFTTIDGVERAVKTLNRLK